MRVADPTYRPHIDFCYVQRRRFLRLLGVAEREASVLHVTNDDAVVAKRLGQGAVYKLI